MKAKGESLAEDVQASVLNLIRSHSLIDNQERLLVAVSGGQDSVCLLHVLAGLRSELNIKLYVVHLDHGLRGAESETDARYVARLAKKLGIPATIEKRDVNSFRTKHKLSLEEAAREVRYAFFADAATAIGTDRVAVAHTSDDHIETILMHLIRGSGIRGLRGLQPVNRWRSGDRSLTVVRPLLMANRAATEAYCRTLHLRPKTDSSNFSMSPFRNRVRLELLPLLKKYNPGIGEALQRTSFQAAEAMIFLDNESRRLWDKVVRRKDGGFLLEKSEFLKVSPVLQKGLLLLMLEKLLGNLTGIESRHVEEITAAMNLPAGRSINLPGGLIFAVDYDKFSLTRGTNGVASLPPLEGETKLTIPGKTRLSGWLVSATILDGMEMPPCENNPSNPVIPAEAGIYKNDGFTAYLDLDKVGTELVVRGLKSGDSFYPLGMDKPKKVARFMIDARIPRSWRDRVPIVASPSQIVWVVGWRIDERVKIAEGTRNALRLEFKRTG